MTHIPNLSHWAVTHRPMVLFVLIAVLSSGVFAFLKLGRLEDPNFRVPTMTAVVAWPGATAQEVQDEVLNRIERKLQELDHFDNVRTFSRQGYGPSCSGWAEAPHGPSRKPPGTRRESASLTCAARCRRA
jgi:Cu/Ag efflux pump CusA